MIAGRPAAGPREEAPRGPLDDVREVAKDVSAIHYGSHRLQAGFSLSNRLLRETHRVLLSAGRGCSMTLE